MKTIRVTIEGVTPIMFHRFSDEAALKVEEGKSKSIQAEKLTPREQAENFLHLDSNRKPVIPQTMLSSAITGAGIFHKVGRKQVTTGTTSIVTAAVTIQELEVPLLDREGNEPRWEVDSRPIVNPATRGRRLCHRPMFHSWQASFTMEIDTDIIDEKLARDLVDDAGKRLGIGSFRPQKKGPYGRFKVVSWKVTNGAA